MITSAQIWLAVEVVSYIVFFALWDQIMIYVFGANPATRSAVGNAILAVALVFGFRIITLTEKVSKLEKEIEEKTT